MMDKLIDIIFDNFDFTYMISINVLTYLMIKIIDYINKEKVVSTFVKRICLVIAIIAVTITYLLIGYDNKLTLINSAILSPVFYSWVLRPILVHFNVNYKQANKEINKTLK